MGGGGQALRPSVHAARPCAGRRRAAGGGVGGGQAAAAAHSLGTPLATISVVAKELKKEIGNEKEFSKDIDLLISQTKRCSEILKQISKKQIEEDIFLSSIKFEDLLEEIINSFKETSSKKIKLFCHI